MVVVSAAAAHLTALMFEREGGEARSAFSFH